MCSLYTVRSLTVFAEWVACFEFSNANGKVYALSQEYAAEKTENMKEKK